MHNDKKGIPIRLLARQSDHACAKEIKLTPLHQAAFAGSEDMVRELIKQGVDVHSRDAHGWTPLHDAAIQGHTHIVKLLLQAGADVNAQDNKDLYTPLHDAVRMHFIELAKLLLAAGADSSLRDRWNQTARDIAQEHKFHDIVDALR